MVIAAEPVPIYLLGGTEPEHGLACGSDDNPAVAHEMPDVVGVGA
jgi:hypothetical protein